MSGTEKLVKLKKKDFTSDQDVRWCPGCGDYAILAAVQKTLPEIGVAKEDAVFVSGIGCSSRFPYYMATYGFHSIHGRAPAIATGLKVTRPELSVWVITGDGDGLSIGGNHMLHALRRNVDLTILLFNNKIYGLTKGQYSPTSEVGKKAPSTPLGSVDYPVNPLTFAIGSGATFVARSVDTDAKTLGELLKRAHAHQGTSLIEILQNCPVFNDEAWGAVADRKQQAQTQIRLEHGQPITWDQGEKGLVFDKEMRPVVVEIGDGDGQVPLSEIAVHDEKGSEAYHLALATLSYPEFPMPIGVLREVDKRSYDSMATEQVRAAEDVRGKGDLHELLRSGMTWRVDENGVPQHDAPEGS